MKVKQRCCVIGLRWQPVVRAGFGGCVRAGVESLTGHSWTGQTGGATGRILTQPAEPGDRLPPLGCGCLGSFPSVGGSRCAGFAGTGAF